MNFFVPTLYDFYIIVTMQPIKDLTGESNTKIDRDFTPLFRQSSPSLILLHDRTPVHPCMSMSSSPIS